ncbi:MAG: MgtC/SapB family protein [Pseudochelatococcus sp.]|uniref:MgtC/SapB family protein n=1 Tax=Pseudochelatococcus sp. TaxID=2020869 RepID=UPI003D9227BB
MQETLLQELSMSMTIPLEVVFVRLLGAAVLSGLIGLERELHRIEAGLRTNMLIGVAAAILCIVTLEMMNELHSSSDAARMDPIRLVEAVTAGVAFLAAGVVVYSRGDVKGLTTGASMWLAGAIGLSAGLGLWPLALLASGLGVAILWILRKLQVAAGIKDEAENK